MREAHRARVRAAENQHTKDLSCGSVLARPEGGGIAGCDEQGVSSRPDS